MERVVDWWNGMTEWWVETERSEGREGGGAGRGRGKTGAEKGGEVMR